MESWSAFALGLSLPIAYAFTAIMGQLSMAGGANAIGASSTRQFTAAAVFALYIWWTKVDTAIPWRQRVVASLLGAGHAFVSWSLYTSFSDLPVGVAILILYGFPIMTAVASWLLGTERPDWTTAIALIVAFIGLLLAIDLGGGEVRARGVFFASLAAIGFATIMMVSERLFKGVRAQPRTFHTLIGGAIANILILLFVATPLYPNTPLGWFGLWGNAAFYSFAIIGLYAAIAKLGALKTAMLLNMEPIGTIMLAWLILGQRLSPIQLVGAALVIGSILFVSRPRSVASGAKQG